MNELWMGMEQNDAEWRTKDGSRKASTAYRHHKIQNATSHPTGLQRSPPNETKTHPLPFETFVTTSLRVFSRQYLACPWASSKSLRSKNLRYEYDDVNINVPQQLAVETIPT